MLLVDEKALVGCSELNPMVLQARTGAARDATRRGPASRHRRPPPIYTDLDPPKFLFKLIILQ